MLIQGGDCAERFSDCNLEQIANKIKIMLQMSFVVTYGAKTPTVRIGKALLNGDIMWFLRIRRCYPCDKLLTLLLGFF